MAKNYKTIALTGTEQKVVLAGQNCDIRNDSVDIVYASSEAGITSGADGVLSIPAGQAAKLLDCCGTLYILGTGSVMLCGNDYSELVFKTAATSSGEGGGTVDDVARQAISSHANNEDIHLTAEKAIEAAATAISNPNLLINPNFKINQRGELMWDYGNDLGYCVDCWKTNSGSLSDSGILVKGTAYLVQELEGDFKNLPLVLSVVQADGKMTHISFVTEEGEWFYNTTDNDLFIEFGHKPQSNSYVSIRPLTNDTTIKYAKLEIGSTATPFVPPNPAAELAKCQRYYQRLGGSASSTGTFGTGFIGGTSYATVNIGLANPMRIRPTITITGEVCLATGGYNGADGVIRTSTWVSGWHSTTSSATVVLDISHVADETIVGNACLLQIRDATSYIELSSEL